MKKRNLYLGCLLITISGAIQAQSSFTLEQCKELTLKNNYEIRKSELQLKGAEQSRKEAFTNYFPVVSATGTAMNASAGTMNMEMMGTTLSLMKNGVLGGVTATQPVFAGGNIVNGNKLAKVGVEAQRYQLDLSEDEILLQTEHFYYQIVSLQEKLRTLDQLEEMLQHLRRDVENSFKAGLITQNDVLKVKLKQNELASNRLSVENGLDITKKLLCQHMGTDPSGFSITYDSLWMESPANLLVNHAEVLSARNEYKLLDKNVEANNLQLKIKQGEFLPKVAVGAGYMYHNLTNVNTDFGVVFATVSIPISAWWGGSHAIKKQKINQQVAMNDRQNKSEQLLIQMQQALNDMEESYKQVKLAEEAVAEATENLRLNEDYYKAGTVTLTDLLDAQSFLQQTRDRYTESITVYRLKRSNYLQVTGRY